MIRKLTTRFTFAALRQEVWFTRAALKADPDAADFVPLTDGWLGLIDGVEGTWTRSFVGRLEADAARVVANARLDGACVAFGDRLYLDVGKDRASARWRRFFKAAVSTFVRGSLTEQIATVKSWLTVDDPLVAEARPELTRWADAASTALDQTRNTAQLRGEAAVAKEQLVDDLTRARDGLHAALVARAHEKKLARTWPSVFFLVESPREDDAAPPETPEPA
jgi:hypothetical protein